LKRDTNLVWVFLSTSWFFIGLWIGYEMGVWDERNWPTPPPGPEICRLELPEK